MKARLHRQENSRGEWSVMDPVLGYRICRYNHEDHGGTHAHFPSWGRAGATVELATARQAEAVMHAYAATHDRFDLDELLEVIRAWRSASDGA